MADIWNCSRHKTNTCYEKIKLLNQSTQNFFMELQIEGVGT